MLVLDAGTHTSSFKSFCWHLGERLATASVRLSQPLPFSLSMHGAAERIGTCSGIDTRVGYPEQDNMFVRAAQRDSMDFSATEPLMFMARLLNVLQRSRGASHRLFHLMRRATVWFVRVSRMRLDAPRWGELSS